MKYSEKKESDELLFDKYMTKEQFNSYIKAKSKYPEFQIIGSRHFQRFFNRDYENFIQEEIDRIINPFQRKRNEHEFNPYIEDENKILKDQKKLFYHLRDTLVKYYKTNKINQNFFTNYFEQLTNKLKSEGINFKGSLPISVKEILNDIQYKVELIKNLRFYLSTNLIGRASTYYEQIKIESDEDFIIYNYKVMNEKNYKNSSSFSQLKQLNGKNGKKLRRPIGFQYNSYNYLPIPCKGQCRISAAKTFKEICDFIESDHKKYFPNSYPINNVIDNQELCQSCKKYLDEEHKFKEEIKSKLEKEIQIMYYRTCIFCHNINEYFFHPLIYHTSKNKINNNYKIEIYQDNDCVTYDEKYLNKDFNTNFEIRELYIPDNPDIEKIIMYLEKYNSINCILDRIMNFPNIKVELCPLIQDGKIERHDYSKCPYFHNTKLEKRRNLIIKYNEVCNDKIKIKKNEKLGKKRKEKEFIGQWKNYNELINEQHPNECEYYHNRNEIFFDRRNYRKIYNCPYKYCDLGDLCPYKHPSDIKVNEIYLPEKHREELREMQNKLLRLNNTIMEKLQKIPKCIICNEILGLQFVVCDKGHHPYCHKCQNNCINYCKLCRTKRNHFINLLKNQSLNLPQDIDNTRQNKQNKGNNRNDSMIGDSEESEESDSNNTINSDDANQNNNSMDEKREEKKKNNSSYQNLNYNPDVSMTNEKYEEFKCNKEGLVNPHSFISKNNQEKENEDEDEDEGNEEKGDIH